jgi:hypothetical protein
MSQRHITPAEHNVKLINALRLAVVAFEETDINMHQQAMHELVAQGRTELAQGFTCEWHNAQDMEEEKGRTQDLAYAQAQGYGR